jgi:hypothetical protein
MKKFIRNLCGIWKILLFKKLMGEMEKYVRTWYVILMEDG